MFQILEKVDIDGIADYIKAKKCNAIITLAGAGISTCKSIFIL